MSPHGTRTGGRTEKHKETNDSNLGDKKFVQKFKRVHPDRGREMRVG